MSVDFATAPARVAPPPPSTPTAPESPAPESPAPAAREATPYTVVPRRAPWRWLGVALVLVLLAQFVNGLVTNPGWDWGTFAAFFTTETIFAALATTLQLTLYGTVLGFALGTVLATMRLSKSPFLQVREGGVTVVLGPSRSGKSTLLRVINHLEKVDSGLIHVDDELIGYRRGTGSRWSRSTGTRERLHELPERDILRQRSRIGLVFQNFNLFGHLTVIDNVLEAPLAHGRTRRDVEPEARALLERVGVADKAHADPRQLSGGQQQRVAIARALATGLVGILTKKDNGLVKPLNETLNVAIRDGSYAKVLAKWGLSDEAVKASQINPPGLPKHATT